MKRIVAYPITVSASHGQVALFEHSTDTVLLSYETDVQFVRAIESREPMCRRLVELHRTTRAILPNEAPIYFENLVDFDTPSADFQFIQVRVSPPIISALIACNH